jgi:hypothetical protein
VIAYAPKIDVKQKTARLLDEWPPDLKFRSYFVLYADSGLKSDDAVYLRNFVSRLDDFEKQVLWKSITDKEAKKHFRDENGDELGKFCEIIARSEERMYSKRAKTLLHDHPLAIQVNLDSGVANGVLLVRDIPTCVDLLLRVLTNTMEFKVDYLEEIECWILKETLTESIYRVVTKDPKLTNCFWNFYPASHKIV